MLSLIFSKFVSKLTFSHLLFLFMMAFASMVSAQSERDLLRNNPYSPSPIIQKDTTDQDFAAPHSGREQIAFFTNRKAESRPPAINSNPGEEIKSETKSPPIRAADIYTVGPTDVLFISMSGKNRYGGYFTVRSNGTIGFPAGDQSIGVAGLTVEEIQTRLAVSIKLDDEDKIEVSIREYSSHRVLVSGLVQNAGQVVLRRDAMPLFAIRAQAVVHPEAKTAVIKRSGSSSVQKYDLTTVDDGSILIYPGDSVEFALD